MEYTNLYWHDDTVSGLAKSKITKTQTLGLPKKTII